MVKAAGTDHPLLVNCIVPLHMQGPLTYRWPFDTPLPERGTRLLLPLGHRRIVGICWGPAREFLDESRLKNVLKVMEEQPLIPGGLLNFIEWAASYYYYPLGPALSEALPAGFLSATRKATEQATDRGIGPGRSRFDVKAWSHGIVRQLTAEQENVLSEIAKAVTAGVFSPYLLFGITGSGKTEVYMRAVEHCLASGRNALVLVPEISMTGQIAGWFAGRFAQGLSLLHSGLTREQRRDQWWKIRSGESRIVVGARSAIFAPLQNIGLVIIDEEHDPSYKQADKFKYNARDLAVMRGRMEGATVVLGSGTPSVTSYFNALSGKYCLLEMKERAGDARLPSVEIVDRRVRSRKKRRDVKKDAGRSGARSDETPWLSSRLRHAISSTLEAGHQVLLFLNRRGFATYVFCQECGHVFKCRSCDVVLAWHRGNKALLRNVDTEKFKGPGVLCCHYCGQLYPALPACDKCSGQAVRASGFGTEKVANDFLQEFPGTTVARIDRDTVGHRKKMERILHSFRKGEIDCLIGTQMITKGHDFPNLALVGVIAPDMGLNVPEYCAAERTFQLMAQVAGRAGRSAVKGRVIIQTYMPDHYAMECATAHDYRRFYEIEIAKREALGYPPFSRLVNVRLSAAKKAAAEEAALKLADVAEKAAGNRKDIIILGPVQSPLARISSRYRYQLMIKGAMKPVRRLCSEIDRRVGSLVPSNVRVEIDVDPLNFM